jgi:hypothetical protein
MKQAMSIAQDDMTMNIAGTAFLGGGSSQGVLWAPIPTVAGASLKVALGSRAGANLIMQMMGEAGKTYILQVLETLENWSDRLPMQLSNPFFYFEQAPEMNRDFFRTKTQE